MRLLNVNTTAFEEYFEPDIPEYAILSHRWEDDEILFADILAGTFEQKNAFQKLSYTCQQAKNDALDYVWIDTFCIDKSSSADLSEAINSMFRWYRESAICYVYLADCVASSDLSKSFTKSVWFTRGWALQELIAPRKLTFYEKSWERLGTREALWQQITERTSIPKEVLTNQFIDVEVLLATYPAARKMSWAAFRKTTRIEDRAYALLGLFGVNMPLLYGEGHRAFLRLQEEILKTGTDLSILAWGYSPTKGWFNDDRSGNDLPSSRRPLFAQSPDQFFGCERIDYSTTFEQRTTDDMTIALTNIGLQIERPKTFNTEHVWDAAIVLSLGCYSQVDMMKTIGLKLQLVSAQAIQPSSNLCLVNWEPDFSNKGRIIEVDFFGRPPSTAFSSLIVSREKLDPFDATRVLSSGMYTHVVLILDGTSFSEKLNVLDIYPEDCWQENNLTFHFRNPEGYPWEEDIESRGNLGAIALENTFGDQVTITFVRVSFNGDYNFVVSATVYNKDRFGSSSFLVWKTKQELAALCEDKFWLRKQNRVTVSSGRDIKIDTAEAKRGSRHIMRLSLIEETTQAGKRKREDSISPGRPILYKAMAPAGLPLVLDDNAPGT